MSKFNHLDPIALKAFYFAAIYENFTKASEAAHITQSGVSQHVAKLELELNVELFVRVGKKVKLTEAGKQLKQYTEDYLTGLDALFEKLGRGFQNASGRVSYAMPASCLLTPHFPMLLKAREKYPEIDLKLNICHSEEVLEKLLKNEIDFGFMTKFIPHRDVDQIEFAQEEYVLVSSDKELIRHFDIKKLGQYKFINYPGMNSLFESWIKNKSKKSVSFYELQFSGEVNDLDAAITMCQYGLGVGIFPKHCIQRHLDSKLLFMNSSLHQNKELYSIYLVKLQNTKTPARIQIVVDEFLKMKKS
jgi:DNA-binding transcriptional LysR family regulator